MALSRKSQKLFIEDSLLLARRGVAGLRDLDTQASAENVRRLFHAIHSLKGTAAMVPDARAVVEPLQKLEAVLTLGGDFGGLAKRYPQWRGAALGALENATRALKHLHEGLRQEAFEEEPQPLERMAWVLKVGIGDAARQVHIPLDDIVEFKWTDGVDSASPGGFPWVPWQGAWIRRHSLGTESRTSRGEWLSLVLKSDGSQRGDAGTQACLLSLGREVRMEGILTEAQALQAGVPPWHPELGEEIAQEAAETAA